MRKKAAGRNASEGDTDGWKYDTSREGGEWWGEGIKT